VSLWAACKVWVAEKGMIVFTIVLDVVIGGLIMGGIYALIAVGLSLQYGVGRVLNISHGEFIMIGAFATWSLYTLLGVSPLVSLIICGPVLFIIGFLIHRTLFWSPLHHSECGVINMEG
jgi:branched-subunit amino acid ABC-type transport system permease component